MAASCRESGGPGNGEIDADEVTAETSGEAKVDDEGDGSLERDSDELGRSCGEGDRDTTGEANGERDVGRLCGRKSGSSPSLESSASVRTACDTGWCRLAKRTRDCEEGERECRPRLSSDAMKGRRARRDGPRQ